MPIAPDPNAVWPYVLKEDRELPAKQRTRFLLRPLTVREAAQVEDGVAEIKKSGEVSIAAGSQTLQVLRFGLAGWENFADITGLAIPFKTIKSGHHRGLERFQATDETLDFLLPAWRRELAEAITERIKLTEGELGN